MKLVGSSSPGGSSGRWQRARAAVGIDVGGTTVKAGVVTDGGEVLFLHRSPVPQEARTAQGTIRLIVETAKAAWRDGTLDGLNMVGAGLGMPNYTVGVDWVQTHCNSLPELEDVALRAVFETEFGQQVACDMDTHAATIGELWVGEGRSVDRLMCLLIGTGVSCGVAIDGHLLRYTHDTSGDLGHVIVNPLSEARCTCGCRGCLEAMVTGPAIRRAARAALAYNPRSSLHGLGHALDVPDLVSAAELGDDVARDVLSETGAYLGVGLSSLIHIFGPEVILIGGGISQAGEWLLGPARRVVDRLVSPFFSDGLSMIKATTLGVNAGVIGAAGLVLFGRR